MKIKELFTTLVVLIGIIGSMSAFYVYLDGRYALAGEQKKLEKKVSLIELNQVYKEALDNLYFFRKQAREYPEDEDIKNKLKESEEECDHLKQQIAALKAKEDEKEKQE